MNAQVQYQVGEVYLRHRYKDSDLTECKILAVAKNAKAVRISEGWIDAVVFHDSVNGRLGRYEKRRFLWWTREVFVCEA